MNRPIVVYDAGRDLEYDPVYPVRYQGAPVGEKIHMLYLSQSKHYQIGIPRTQSFLRPRRGDRGGFDEDEC